MKRMLVCFQILFCINCKANTYYFSSNGNDGNTGITQESPYQTLAKLNSLQLIAGDNILFRRNDTFYGAIVIKKSGQAGFPITFGAYGAGANPVITGFITIKQWVQMKKNLWISITPVSSLAYTDMVVIQGKNTPMGRFPNDGYFLYSNPTSDPYTVSCNDFTSGGVNWTGAELVANNTTYTILRNPITSQQGNVITFTHDKKDINWQKSPGYLIPKCFVQNDLRTLDATSEWYFDPLTSKIIVYNSSMPQDVKVAAVDTLLKITSYGKNYISINSIDFSGSNKAAIEIHNCKNISISNCNFIFSGLNAIHADYGNNQDSIAITGCMFNNTNNCAIKLSLNCTNAIINNNIITNTGMILGMMQNSAGAAVAIIAAGAGSIVSNNEIDSVGYNGIQVSGNNAKVFNNYIQHFCEQLLDGAGIYTYNGSTGAEENGLQIYNNTILYAASKNEGIYLDDKTNNVKIYGNTIAYCNRGIYMHNTWNTDVTNNTCFANNIALASVSDNKTVTARNNSFHNNYFVAKNATDKLEYFQALHDNEMISDSNYIIGPTRSNDLFQMKYNGANSSSSSLSEWQSKNNQENHSHQPTKEINDAKDMVLEFNATSSAKTISLDNKYMDAAGKVYTGSLSLQPHTSIVLIKAN